jgi:hypothetical protein
LKGFRLQVAAQHHWTAGQTEFVEAMLVVHEIGHTFRLFHGDPFPEHAMTVPPDDPAELNIPSTLPLYQASDINVIRKEYAGW